MMGLIAWTFLKAVTIGSDSAVQRFPTQQTLNTGDRVAGFAALDGGFALATNATATFDAFFPVSGNVALNGGVILLYEDLYFENLVSFMGTGTISGNGHMLAFSPSQSVLTGTCTTFANVNWELNGDITLLGNCLVLSGNTVVNGNGNLININPTASIQIDRGANVLFENVSVRNIHTGQLLCLDTLGTITFQNAQLVLDGDYTFTNGHIEVFNQLLITGNGHSFIYTSTQTSLVWNNATLTLDDSVTFSYMLTSTTGLTFVDNTSQLFLNNAIFATVAGIAFQKGGLIVDGNSLLTNAGTGPATSVAFGDGAFSTNNFTIRILPAANLSIQQGYFQYNNL